MILNWKPTIDPKCQQCPCGLPNDCSCNLHNVRRILEIGQLNLKCKCKDDCVCPNPFDCYRELKRQPQVGDVCVCKEICTCDIKDECFINEAGCICSPKCTCGWWDCCKGAKSKILYEKCSCGDACPCSRKEDCYRIPLIIKEPKDEGCYCGAKCPCQNPEECYFRQVKDKDKQFCVCGSGLYFADCKCFNKEYCYHEKWPPCACKDPCECPNRETCFIESKKYKCKNCDASCLCGYKDFCHKIEEKKKTCVCGLLTGCTCFNQDTCIYTDKIIRIPYCMGDNIGRKVKPITNIQPLPYEKYNEDGSFKTPYATSVMIKFVNISREVLYKHPFQITANINELRRDIAFIYKLKFEQVILRSAGQELHQTLIVAELGYKPYDIVELFLDARGDVRKIPDYYAMVIPDIITIPIKLDEYLHKDVTIEIYDKRIEKPFLGGYRHKVTGVEYHHAYTQTGERLSKIPPELLNNRDTQTYWWRNRKQDTTYAHATQMTSTDTTILNTCDRVLSYSGSYEDSEAWEKRIDFLNKVLTIQRYFRAWKMRQALHYYHKLYWELDANKKLYEKTLEEAERNVRLNEIVRKVYPRSRADYAMLYGMVARWKQDETNRIYQSYTKAARLAELYILLDREVKILNIIEHHRREVREDLKLQQEMDFFEEISAPITWYGYKHLLIKMHTEKTQKGERYKELYLYMLRRDLPNDQRLTLLLSVKYALRNHYCRLVQELIELLDQECELLIRNFGNSNLDILRKRQQLLLLEHVKSVQCHDCPVDPIRKHKDVEMLYCYRCRRIKFCYDFPLRSCLEKTLKLCLSCSFIDLTTAPFINIAPYRIMLEFILKKERELRTESCMMYMITDHDIQYIVDVIWHGHSILTENRDLYDLRLVRWRIHEPWSPWNCALFSAISAKAHEDVENPEEIYGQNICNDVANKQLLGRKKFSQMHFVDQFFKTTGEPVK